MGAGRFFLSGDFNLVLEMLKKEVRGLQRTVLLESLKADLASYA